MLAWFMGCSITSPVSTLLKVAIFSPNSLMWTLVISHPRLTSIPRFQPLLKDNLIGIGELEDLLVRSPVLNLSARGRSSQSNVLSQVRLVVKSVEVTSLTLIRSLGRIADHLTVIVIPTRLEVRFNSGLIELVEEEVL